MSAGCWARLFLQREGLAKAPEMAQCGGRGRVISVLGFSVSAGSCWKVLICFDSLIF